MVVAAVDSKLIPIISLNKKPNLRHEFHPLPENPTKFPDCPNFWKKSKNSGRVNWV